ncbi:hypothetical protein L6R52_05530 [Myxococcota bacterium]|nr:hypothetical protein [Myxococcota bacterium]
MTVPQDRSPPDVLALDVAAPGTVGVPASALRAGTLHALTYDCRLSALELGEGALTVVASELEGRSLPAPASIAIATATGWERRPELPAELAGLHLAHPPVERTPCTTFRTSSLAVPAMESDYIDLSLALDDRSMLLGSRSGRFFRATRDEIVELPEMTGLPDGAMFVEPDGRVWLLDRVGTTFVGHPDTGFEPGPSLSMPGTCVRAAASPPGQPFEAFAATCEGSVMRFDGARWTTITIGDTTRQPPSLAWAAPGEVYVAGTHPPAVVRFVDGELVAEEVPVPSRDSASLVVVNPVLGPLAGTDVGSLFRKTSEGWVSLAALSSLQRIRVALPIEGGTLFGGGGGELVQYYDEYGLCPPEELVAGHVWTAAVLGETLAVVVVGVRGSVVVYLDREPVPEKVWPAACPAE